MLTIPIGTPVTPSPLRVDPVHIAEVMGQGKAAERNRVVRGSPFREKRENSFIPLSFAEMGQYVGQHMSEPRTVVLFSGANLLKPV